MTHYCFQCGTQLELRLRDNREREICPACEWVYYAQLKVGAAVLIEQNDKLLLLKRNYEPWAGTWMVPAGYVEADEDPRDAAVREVREETGLQVELSDLQHVYYFDDDPRGKGVSFVYRAEKILGEIKLNGESSEAKFFHWHEIPSDLTLGGHDKMIMAWREMMQQRES
jgi:ADP-ribose pyrophosphatase YjhB (NUDIX family)